MISFDSQTVQDKQDDKNTDASKVFHTSKQNTYYNSKKKGRAAIFFLYQTTVDMFPHTWSTNRGRVSYQESQNLPTSGKT
jgi:hypothetical protein